ncbi:LVIVD repeat-containing protein [Flavobacterium sp. GT3R68]|uniref:LVIVD repeat-containing protein n=1 Tax=Flavobacterium sp. GT3R68 TaxID=2594437 RepID=UPI000F868497|nr:hypothetical protein [Flavobacterium sp. GT3R68]RTY95795.1 hypothetical protein EKL32_03905 [Flavobacterium sp. GSN2]TRW93567.1 hypothetical protein FNW07_01295 [Flavobacterium sp. GT3R68]
MKTFKFILVTCLVGVFSSCTSDDTPNEQAVFAVPIVKTLAAIRSSVNVTGARTSESDGKIYVTENYLFYIAQEEGIHIFDNHNPATPQNIAFIHLDGVHDIAVKNNTLYADNYTDLTIFDISDISNIHLTQTLENAVTFNPSYPASAEYYDYTVTADPDELVVGFTLETRNRPYGQELILANDALGAFESSNGVSIGTGGSYARFQINNNALYTIDSYQLKVFNITDPLGAFFDKAVTMMDWFGGGQFETLFMQKHNLFVGSTTGMHIVDASDPFNPYFVSTFSHATACDPVVVFMDTAYITVRGGNSCGAIEDQVNVIDVTDISSPTLLSTTLVAQPYGLGFRENILYVCCGSEGLKVFDASDSSNLTLRNSYPDDVTDVIPLNTHLIAVGANKIIQYSYGADFTLEVISIVNF